MTARNPWRRESNNWEEDEDDEEDEAPARDHLPLAWKYLEEKWLNSMVWEVRRRKWVGEMWPDSVERETRLRRVQ